MASKAKTTKSDDTKSAGKAPAIVKKKAPVADEKSTSVRRTRAAASGDAPAPAAKAAPKPAPVKAAPVEVKGFAKKQQQRLLELRDALMDSMTGMASETLRNRAEGSEASAFGMHQADAGTDAYDRDFALNLLGQEQDALYEIDEALKRVLAGTYGVCEMCGKKIPVERLEALPFARFTIDCQQQVEKEMGPGNSRRSVRSLFGLMGSEDEDEDGDEESVDNEKE